MTNEAPVQELDLPSEMLTDDESLTSLREYCDSIEFVVIVTDPEAFYDRLGILEY